MELKVHRWRAGGGPSLSFIVFREWLFAALLSRRHRDIRESLMDPRSECLPARYPC